MALIHKSFDTEQTAVKVEAPDIAAIRKYALRDVAEDDVWIGSMKLCHDRYDRTHERFTKAYLDRFAETLPGKAVMGGHDYSTLPLGRFYSAEVIPDAEGHHLRVRYYLPKDSPLVPQIELGVLRDVSVGFNAGRRLCDVCGDTWRGKGCDHYPGQEIDGKTVTLTYCETEAYKAEAMEGSFVWLGAQPGAEAVALAAKHLQMGGVITASNAHTFFDLQSFPIDGQPRWDCGEESGMTFKTMEEAVAEVKRLQALPLAADRETELQKQISELQAKIPLADDGLKYREHLKGEVLRVAGVLGKTATYTTLLEHMANASATSLQPVLDELLKEYDEKLSGGRGRTGLPLDDDDNTKNGQGLLMSRLTGGLL